MRYFSMFSGIGGFEEGIRRAYELQAIRNRSNGEITTSQHSERPFCVGYSEIEKNAVKVYERHFKEHKNYSDATRIVPEEIPDFDFLCGGFPCQAFSIAGKRGGFKDTRGTLFFEIARILSVKRPKLLLLENVKGLLSHDSGRTFGTILATLSELGYFCEWQVLNSKDFGVPQNRERVFIIGHLRGTSRPQVFPLRGNNQADIVVPTLTTRYGEAQANGSYLREITAQGQSQGMRVYDPEGISTTLASQAGGLGAKTGLYLVNDPSRKKGVEIKEESPTLRSECHGNLPSILKDSRIRRLTPKECERLQGFPDGWTEGLSDSARYRCLGNAVTVNVITAIMEKIIGYG